MLTRLYLAVQFLTILPLPAKSSPPAERDVGKSSMYFPLVGLLQGFLLLLVFTVFIRILPNEIVAALVIAALVICNGGLHFDGLSDTFDALAARKSMEKKLAIMKDSTTGPIGVISTVLVLLLKYLAYKNALTLAHMAAFVPLILSPVIARWSMVPALFHGKSARDDGLGKVFLEHTKTLEMIGSTTLVLCVT
ncbi:MAG: adenosylcobinamide-GDP ribazoletransferase, partial [Desulfobacterales bacterium]|nr:adenosylcobinamide-GDP ribazoletransferase [Desulfobacterales bacterium]